jgi:hypothetical protein
VFCCHYNFFGRLNRSQVLHNTMMAYSFQPLVYQKEESQGLTVTPFVASLTSLGFLDGEKKNKDTVWDSPEVGSPS